MVFPLQFVGSGDAFIFMSLFSPLKLFSPARSSNREISSLCAEKLRHSSSHRDATSPTRWSEAKTESKKKTKGLRYLWKRCKPAHSGPHSFFSIVLSCYSSTLSPASRSVRHCSFPPPYPQGLDPLCPQALWMFSNDFRILPLPSPFIHVARLASTSPPLLRTSEAFSLLPPSALFSIFYFHFFFFTTPSSTPSIQLNKINSGRPLGFPRSARAFFVRLLSSLILNSCLRRRFADL